MSTSPRPRAAAAEPRAEVDDLRLALIQLLGAERRLRGRDQIRPDELTYGQVRAIALLDRETELTAGQLAKGAELNPASVTAMLDHLEAANIVQRHRSTKDRRVCNVSLTDHGREVLEQKLVKWQSLWTERMSEFTDDEVETAAKVLRQVSTIFASLSGADDD